MIVTELYGLRGEIMQVFVLRLADNNLCCHIGRVNLDTNQFTARVFNLQCL